MRVLTCAVLHASLVHGGGWKNQVAGIEEDQCLPRPRGRVEGVSARAGLKSPHTRRIQPSLLKKGGVPTAWDTPCVHMVRNAHELAIARFFHTAADALHPFLAVVDEAFDAGEDVFGREMCFLQDLFERTSGAPLVVPIAGQ